MADIESLGYELAYKSAETTPNSEGHITIRSELRALTGMQKEALVHNRATGIQWRMVCDEGPYLNGTDLAPFPLAFYTTGMAFSFTSELLRHARAAGVTFRNFKLTQDNFYTMQGSALRGNMIGGALPVEVALEIDADGDRDALEALIAKAVQTSPPQRYANEVLENRFALAHNGSQIEAGDVVPVDGALPDEPTANLDAARPVADDQYEQGIISKTSSAETVFGVEGGAGSSLQATQKRTLHVRGVVTLRDDGLMQCDVQLFKPLGSNFRFIGDDSGSGRAPDSLSYLSAGVGFCFMTQIGRYAHIAKQNVSAYSVVQDTSFAISNDASIANPVDTYTYLQSSETDAAAQKNLWMSERTCFLHAAMRGSAETKITLK